MMFHCLGMANEHEKKIHSSDLDEGDVLFNQTKVNLRQRRRTMKVSYHQHFIIYSKNYKQIIQLILVLCGR